MGAFADLETTATSFGPHQSYLDSIKDEYSAASTPLILKTEAKAALKLDLQTALGLLPSDSEDMTTLDTIVEAQEERMQMVLALKQLSLVYEDRNQGEGSKSYDYWRHYTAAYDRERKGFSGLIRKQGSVRSRSIGMYR